jgi:hypothetical protein
MKLPLALSYMHHLCMALAGPHLVDRGNWSPRSSSSRIASSASSRSVLGSSDQGIGSGPLGNDGRLIPGQLHQRWGLNLCE